MKWRNPSGDVHQVGGENKTRRRFFLPLPTSIEDNNNNAVDRRKINDTFLIIIIIEKKRENEGKMILDSVWGTNRFELLLLYD